MIHVQKIADIGEVVGVLQLCGGPYTRGLRQERVTQSVISDFANITGDRQWIHVDPERAATESPFGRSADSPLGKTIAHGDLIFALRNVVLPLSDVLEIDEVSRIVHREGSYLFREPVCAGHSIRGFWRMPEPPVVRKNMLITKFDYKICIVEQDDKCALEGSIKVLFFA